MKFRVRVEFEDGDVEFLNVNKSSSSEAILYAIKHIHRPDIDKVQTLPVDSFWWNSGGHHEDQNAFLGGVA